MTLVYSLILLIAVPLLTALLMGRSPRIIKTDLRKAMARRNPSLEALENVLQKINVQIESEFAQDESDPESAYVIRFRYQGGMFQAVLDRANTDERKMTTAIYFMSCFEAKPEHLAALFETVNDLLSFQHPIRPWISVSDDKTSLTVNAAVFGLRISDAKGEEEYMREMLNSFFEVRSIVAQKFKENAEQSPNALMDTYMPRARAAYAVNLAQVEMERERWEGVWFRRPDFSIRRIVETMLPVTISDKAKLYVAGEETMDGVMVDNIYPLASLVADDPSADNPIAKTFISIDIVEPDHKTHRDIHLLLTAEEVDERLITVRAYASASGLEPTPFRPPRSADTFPLSSTSLIGINRQGEEAYRAEAEYMAQEEGLVEKMENPDMAASLYWGRILFTQQRYIEAIQFLETAFKIFTKEDIASRKPAQLEGFFELCYFLSVSYFMLDRGRDALYYISLVPHQQRVEWTKQFLITLAKLDDFRIVSMLQGLKENIDTDPDEDGEMPEHISDLLTFIDRELAVAHFRRGETEEARKMFEEMIAKDPADAFALDWLSRL